MTGKKSGEEKPEKSPTKTAKEKKEKPEKTPSTGLEKPLAAAYRVMGGKSKRFLLLFKDLDQTLLKSGLKANFKAYVSLTLIVSFAIAVPVAVAISLLLFFLFHMPLMTVLLFGVGAALITWVASVGGFYLYPVYRADKHKRELNDELPFTTGYMSILASAGVSPEKILQSLANLGAPLAASTEAKEVLKNINLFGLDIISALEKVSAVTPSEKLQETFEGMISTIHTGGNLGSYLREKFKIHMRLKRLNLKKYADSLSVMAEVYVALLLTAPLLLIIMLSVMSMLGGGTIGPFSSDLLLNLMTYIGIPVAAAIFLVIVDSMTPKW
jgi:flagellar protein FlaJ